MAIGPYLLVHFFYGLYYLVVIARRETPQQQASKNQRRSGVKPRWRPSFLSILILAAELVLLVVILLGQTRGVLHPRWRPPAARIARRCRLLAGLS